MHTSSSCTHEFVEKRYQDVIRFYWRAAKYNRRYYKATRALILILGALVTLSSSVAATKALADYPYWSVVFGVGTPVMAALLSILGGFAQNFQFGAAWQNMVLTAERLQKEYDRFRVTKPEDRKLAAELETLNGLVLDETKTFFDRLLGSGEIGSPK